VIRDPSDGRTQGVEFVITIPLLRATGQEAGTAQPSPDGMATGLAHSAS